jgi:hypothetical protein
LAKPSPTGLFDKNLSFFASGSALIEIIHGRTKPQHCLWTKKTFGHSSMKVVSQLVNIQRYLEMIGINTIKTGFPETSTSNFAHNSWH